MAQPPQILMSGYYGAGNLGDEALLAGLLEALGTGRAAVRVASLAPQATQQLHGVRAVHRLRGMPLALWRSDVVVSGGGGLLQDATSARSLQYYLGVLSAARALGKRVVVYGQSLGPLSERGAAQVARALHGVPLALRDAPSLALARQLGLDAVRVADAALLLDAPKPPTSTAADLLVLIPRGGYPNISTTLAELGVAHQQRGGRVRIVLLHPAVDRLEGERLLATLPRAELLEPQRPSEALTALAGVLAVISGRLHGLVLAAVAAVPTAGISYDPKVAGFADDLNAPVVAAAEGSAALHAFLAKPTLDFTARDQLRQRSREGFAWLQQHLQAT
jgi:polysaccharide pyruvyl transferase CsaB